MTTTTDKGGGSERFIEDKLAGAALRESKEHYRAVAEAAKDGIITINSESIILFVNPAAERIFGYSNEEMLGQPLTMLMPKYLRHLHRAGITRYVETGRKHMDWAAVELPWRSCFCNRLSASTRGSF